MHIFRSLAQEKSRKLILIFFSLSSLLPILLILYIGINYVQPHLTPDQADRLRPAFVYSIWIMLLFPSLSFFILSQWMGSLESLASDIKSQAGTILQETGEADEDTNEITAIRMVVDGLHSELQEKMDQLNAYSKKLIDFNIELSELSITDDLTGLFNRRHFDLRLQEEIDRAERYEKKLALIMIDVDGFKQYNDILGHQSGDVLLKTVSRIFQENIRKTDIPFRYGGDEFAIVLTESTMEGALSVAQKLSEAVARCPFGGMEQLPFDKVTISCGVAAHANGMKNLIAEADKYLYEAKNAGKGLVRSSSGQ